MLFTSSAKRYHPSRQGTFSNANSPIQPMHLGRKRLLRPVLHCHAQQMISPTSLAPNILHPSLLIQRVVNTWQGVRISHSPCINSSNIPKNTSTHLFIMNAWTHRVLYCTLLQHTIHSLAFLSLSETDAKVNLSSDVLLHCP